MAEYNFDKSKRILSKRLYSSVFSSKLVICGKYWKVIFKKTNSNAKLGLVVAKKNHKLAVTRNNLKRIAREFFRLNQDKLINLNIIILSKKFSYATNKNLFSDLCFIIKKIR